MFQETKADQIFRKTNIFYPLIHTRCEKIRIRRNKRDIAAKKILTLLAEATIKAATKEKTCDFYFKNKDLDLIADEFLCHQPCCKSFTIGYSCSFRKASPMIIFGKALNYPLSIVSLGLFNAD